MTEGREPERAAERFKLRGQVGPAVTALVVSIALFLGGLILLRRTTPNLLIGAALFGLPAVFGALAAWWTQGAGVLVGEDGVRIERPLRNRFIPIADIAHVVSGGARLTIVLKDREQIELTSFSGSSPDLVASAIADALEARDRRRAEALQRLSRKGRPLREWAEDLRGLLDRGGGFRQEAVTEDAVRSVLDDPTQPIEQRIGAAIALSKVGQSERVRIAADASAQPKVRVALSKIAGGEDDLDREVELLLAEEEAARAG